MKVVPDGFCYNSVLSPSKENGYIQLSVDGVNKFCTLNEMLAWAARLDLDGGKQVSHLCHNPKCTIPAHVCAESVSDNNRRKGCLVFIDCPHRCAEKILVCPHRPLCVKHVPGYETWEDFLKYGIH